MLKKITLLLMLMFLWTFSVKATQIVASVNDEIITSQDVEDRIQLMKQMFNMSDEELPKDKVLDALINEKVKILSAQKAGISLTPDEMKEHVALLEKQNRMPEGSLMEFASRNTDIGDSLISQLQAELFWMKYVQQQNLKRPKVSKKEIDVQFEKTKKEFKQPSYLLAEIYIPFDGNETSAEQLAQTLFNRIVSGDSFTDLALEYSKGRTASRMGDLGWIKLGEMEKAIDEVLPHMKTGQLSRPIKGKDGYTIILMRDKQEALDSDEQEAIQVSQLVLYEQDYEKIKLGLENASKSCMTFTQFAMTNGLKDSHSGALPEMIASRMPADLKRVLEGKEIGELIGPISMPPYIIFVMKCGSRVVSILPSREDIERNLEIQKMEQMADEVLKKARKNLLVDIK